MEDVVIARALHVLAVVVWIGGVMMATTVVLPAVRRGDLGADRLKAFQTIEHRFVWQARTAVIVVGVTGFYMSTRLDLWERLQSAQFWWMHAMICVAGREVPAIACVPSAIASNRLRASPSVA